MNLLGLNFSEKHFTEFFKKLNNKRSSYRHAVGQSSFKQHLLSV